LSAFSLFKLPPKDKKPSRMNSDYLSHEIMMLEKPAYPSNWWTIGVFVFEMICGFSPFYLGQQTEEKMYRLLRSKPINFPDAKRKQYSMSSECQTFVLATMEKNSAKRLGSELGHK